MNFTSDNVYGVDPRIMQAMVAANARLTDVSYCHDDGAKAVDARLSEIFGRDVRAFLVVNGTGANSLALSAICPTYGGVFCHETSHINTDECNCPELFMGGGKLVTMGGEGAKLAPAVLADKLSQFGHGEHGAKPCGLSITNATELGTVYTPAEIRALAEVVRPRGMKVHMDGARFANALVSLGCSPAEMTWKAGVDVLSFGGTKNGGMILEAVVFFDTALADDFLYRRKRTGQLVSKGRFLSAQMLAYLQDDVWLANARRANSLGAGVGQGVAGVEPGAAHQSGACQRGVRHHAEAPCSMPCRRGVHGSTTGRGTDWPPMKSTAGSSRPLPRRRNGCGALPDQMVRETHLAVGPGVADLVACGPRIGRVEQQAWSGR
jgi:threonine aldolase